MSIILDGTIKLFPGPLPIKSLRVFYSGQVYCHDDMISGISLRKEEQVHGNLALLGVESGCSFTLGGYALT
jgi:hypothetical protein